MTDVSDGRASRDMLMADDTLPAAFSRAVAAHGRRTAIGAGGWRQSYRELDETSDRLAHALAARGGAAGDRIALLMRHDTPIVAAMLGGLKAGRVVVTLNPGDPAARLKQLVRDAEPGVILADRDNGALAAAVAEGCAVEHYERCAASGPARSPGIRRRPDDVAFLCYTSGTTGRPKAVMRTHRQELRNARMHSGAWGVGVDDRIALLTSLTGTLGTSITWCALLHGAALYPFATLDKGFLGLAEALTEHRITVLSSTASFFRAFARSLGEDTIFPGIRVVRLGSELVTADDFRAFEAHFSDAASFLHTYGASEVGGITRLVLRRGDRVAAGPLPIGR